MGIKDIKHALVIYHREDNDGVCSAAIVSQFLKEFGYNGVNIKFYGCNYAELSTLWDEHLNGDIHDKLSDWVTKFDHIFMVDISFNEADAMDYLYINMPDGCFIWCDHHYPIIEFSLSHTDNYGFGRTPGIRNTNQSALMNTWEYMVTISECKTDIPDTLVMLSDYDSWTWTQKDKYTGDGKDKLFALNTGFTRRSNLKIKWFEEYIYNILHKNNIWTGSIDDDCLQYGMIILKYDQERSTRAIKFHGDTNWTIGGEKACAVFTTDRFNSQSFSDVFAGTDVKHGIVFKRNPDGRWILSAYNVSNDIDFDCGAYLKANYGGGGHKGAAGCTISRDQFINLLVYNHV